MGRRRKPNKKSCIKDCLKGAGIPWYWIALIAAGIAAAMVASGGTVVIMGITFTSIYAALAAFVGGAAGGILLCTNEC